MKKIQKNTARFENLKQDFLDDKKYSGTAEATLKGYQYDITRFLDFLTGEQLSVNETGFKRYVVHLTDSGMSVNSIRQLLQQTNFFLSQESLEFIANQLFNATATTLVCISQICCFCCANF